MIQDNPLLWKSSKADSSNTSNIDTFGDTIQETIELLHFAGYKVMKPVNKETSFSDVGASEKGEFVSANNVNFVVKKVLDLLRLSIMIFWILKDFVQKKSLY